MSIANVLALIGGVALFLFGMQLMGDGLKKTAGNKLELVLWKLSGTPLKGILLGTFVTAVIQSSSATSAMVVGFVNSGMMTVAQSISIVMGANIGTSVTGWLLCLSMLGKGGGLLSLLSTDTISAVVAFIGIIWLMFSKKETKKNAGGIMLGFAVLMYGMAAMSDAVAPLKESESFRSMLTMFDNPVLGILVGILITALLQSNSASVGILQAISVTGAVTYAAAFPMIMGMGIGASIPVLLSAVGAGRDGKRTSLIYLLINIFGTVICTVLFYGGNALLHFPFMQNNAAIGMVGIATMNTLYRIVAIIVLLPFMKYLERITDRLLRNTPDKKQEPASKAYDIGHLEERFLVNPVLALTQSKEAMQRMADLTENGLFRSFDLIAHYDEAEAAKVIEAEDIVDHYEDMLGTYLIKVTGGELNHEQTLEVSLYLHTVSDFERVSDHSVNIQEAAKEIWEKKVQFSDAALDELRVMDAALRRIVGMTFEAFEKGDLELASKVEPLEECIDMLCQTAKLNHVARLQSQLCTLQQGFVFNDLIGNFERVADHCSNIAVALVELHADSFDTHEYLSDIKSRQNSDFQRLYEQYSQEYAFMS
ncbi:MAG: Na/Pi cotransporter family protein [Oscillospiraceae bacterium]|nr:Na/Pi cotransporter family protein [Oscillospiraceae bacterium]